MPRLTIARKIALAVTALVILCVGTMAWVTSANLQRGFVAYLNEMQTQDLDQLRVLLEARYRKEGNFEWLRRQPDALRDVLDTMQPQLLFEPDGRGDMRPSGPPPRPARRPPPPPRPPPRDNPPRSDTQGYGTQRDNLPREDTQGYATPRDNPPRDDSGQDDPGPPRQQQPPPPAQRDPMGFAQRLSIVDASNRTLIGPREMPPGIERAIKVDGVVVGRMRLMPLRQASASGASAAAAGFLREQLQAILLLAAGLIALAILAAAWLARHLLRPVAALRAVTARLARGELDARAPLLSRDELAELALHVNAMAEALEHSERQRRKMLADVSHELRTPLTVIRGEIEALLDGIRQADAGALASLHAEVLRLNQLVDDLHQLTLADAGDLRFDWQALDLPVLLKPLLERYRMRAAKAGLELGWSLPATLPLRGDGGRLTQVISNLLENSVRYTDRGGQIVLAAALAGEYAEVWVEDSAPGVPAGAHGSIFERLYRVDAARTRERGGSGLGLAICRALVEAHGGTIVAMPSALGGLRIVARLPLQPQHHTGE